MRDSCSTTWEANGYDSTGLATCIDDLESLPMLDPPPYFDGKGQACRFMHADFAAENNAHCPHISLIPIEDVNGKTVWVGTLYFMGLIPKRLITGRCPSCMSRSKARSTASASRRAVRPRRHICIPSPTTMTPATRHLLSPRSYPSRVVTSPR